MNRLRMTLSLAVALLLMATGCGHSGAFQDPQMDFAAIQTVAVMPFANLSRDNLAGDRVRDVFSTMLLATGTVYVLPAGEVARGIGRVGVAIPSAPSTDEVLKLGPALKADAVITGVVKEYGEVRSGSATGNVVAMSAQMVETATGKVVWSASTTKGGIGFTDRLLGSGGEPLNDATEEAVNDLLDTLFR